ncbi:MAG: hypothetical protein MUC84_10420 [Solirubrobacteraceae bacterium]|nr:hypothetical protein [Solirubrobacteraceae bacterium]
MRRAVLLPAILVVLLASASQTHAATCSFTGVGGVGVWHLSGNWSCGHIPTTGDTAVIDSGDDVTVDQDDSVPSLTHTTGTITFAGSSTLEVTSATLLNAGLLTGPGTLRAAGGTLTKSAGTLTIANAAKLELDVPGSLGAGSICLMDQGGGDPRVQLDAALTIGAGVAPDVISCNAGLDGPAVAITPAGSLIKTGAGTTAIDPGVDNDGLLDVQAGTLRLRSPDGATSTGNYQVAAAATLQLEAAQGLTSAASVTGSGTLKVTGGSSTVAAGAVFTPAHLTLDGVLNALTLSGTSPVVTPTTLTLNSGTLTSTRDLAPGTLTAGGGTLAGNSTLTVGPGQTFTKTAGTLQVVDGATLAFDTPATIGAGSICLMDQGGGDPELRINSELAIGAGAAAHVITCNAGLDGPAVTLTAAGTLDKVGSGTTTIDPRVQTAGIVSAAGGQTLDLASGFTQTGGIVAAGSGGALTTGAASSVSGGELRVLGGYTGAVALTGSGRLTGSGTITGSVTNTAGTVGPGLSPGTLTVSGGFTQGPGGTLELDVTGTTPGTQFDVLAVSGHAALDGTVKVLGVFDPQLTDVFAFLTSGSRSGTFASLVSGPLTGGKQYAIDYPSGSPFGAQLVLQPPQAPQNTSPPSITGTPAAGAALTCDPGTWTGSPALTYQWLRDGQPISGETGATYTLAAADAGHAITCRVRAVNASGEAQATSAPIGVPAPAPAGTAPPASAVPAAARPAEEVLAAGSRDQIATALGLPPARRCVSRRNFPIRVRRPPGVTIRAAKVIVDGRPVKTRKVAGRFTATVDLRGLPRGRFTVTVTVTTASGRRIAGARRYRTCAPKRR